MDDEHEGVPSEMEGTPPDTRGDSRSLKSDLGRESGIKEDRPTTKRDDEFWILKAFREKGTSYRHLEQQNKTLMKERKEDRR